MAGTQLNYIEYKQSIFTKTNLTGKITTYYNNDFEKKLDTYFITINISKLPVLTESYILHFVNSINTFHFSIKIVLKI